MYFPVPFSRFIQDFLFKVIVLVDPDCFFTGDLTHWTDQVLLEVATSFIVIP